MVEIRIYVEGGGDDNSLRRKCKNGFGKFFEQKFEGRMPKIKSCGSRAYKDFRTALSSHPDSFCILLVDSEEKIKGKSLWDHLGNRQSGGQCVKPENATDDNVHLMVRIMESWFMADKDALARYFGQGFNSEALPQNPKIEDIPKSDIFEGLKKATRNTKTKGKYDKGSHSFEILGMIDPQKVCAVSPYAKRLFDTLIRKANE